MELRQLEYLIAAVDHGGFTRGAAALHVAQPSMSQSIKALERELGLDLFVRTGRSVRPTAAGDALVDSARRVLRDVADLTSAAAALRGLHTGRLDVVALSTLAVDPLAGLVAELRARHPGVTVKVFEPTGASAVDRWVTSGRAELGLTDLTSARGHLTRIELFREPIFAVCPPRSNSNPLTPASLAALPLVAAPAGTSTRRLLDQALARVGADPNIVVETDQREALVPLVLAGAGTTLLPAGLATEAAARGAVVVGLRPAMSRRIGLVHRPGPLSPAAQAMVNLARAHTASP